VTVAEDIELDDPYENLGVQLVKEAASKTNDVAGDVPLFWPKRFSAKASK